MAERLYLSPVRYTELDCSVVITTWNRARLLADTLHALAAQRVSPTLKWEIVVVDNNSSDETKETVRRSGETSRMRVRYVFEPRQGQSFARNSGVEAADGAVILFTDDDILPRPDWVPAMLNTITRGDLDGAGGRVLPLWEAEPPRWLYGRRHLLTWLALVDEDEACALEYPLMGTRRIVGASMAFRRDVFEEFGCFDTTLGHRGTRPYGGEEVEFINRLLRKGRRIAYEPSIVVHHRIGVDRLRKAFFLRRLFYEACGQARLLSREGQAGIDPLRYRSVARAAGRTTLQTLLRRPEAFSLQLELAYKAGLIWGSLKWPSRIGGAASRARRVS
ncbi:MAG TPA: glycosyltransferase [Methylomirabilota bacterium]|nr:glycosyltransferase [Methylomirabilota bacterium]